MDIKKVVENRRNAIQNAIKKNKFNISAYANYFEVKNKIIKDDISAIYDGKIPKNLDMHSSKVSTVRLLKTRDLMIQTLEKQGLSKDEILETIGMWHYPMKIIPPISLLATLSDITNPKKSMQQLVQVAKQYADHPNKMAESSLLYEAEKYIPHLPDCLEQLQRGQSKTDLAKKYGLTSAQQENLGRIAELVGIQSTHAMQILQSKDARDNLAEIVEHTKNINKIAKISGIPVPILDMIKNGEDVFADITNTRIKIQNRQEEVWQMYNQYGSTHGLTQQEIADIYGCTRATINADIRAYKQKHPEAIDRTQLYRSRHAGEANYFKREMKKSAVLSIFDNIMRSDPETSEYNAVSQIKELTEASGLNIDANTIYQYLMEENRIIPYKHNMTEENISDISHFAQTAYAHPGQFGYGATATLLRQQGVHPGDSNYGTIDQRILNKQRKTMALIRNNEDILTKFKEQCGAMEEIIEDLQQEMEGENEYDR